MFRVLILFGILLWQVNVFGQEKTMVPIKSGTYIPLYGTEEPIHVDGFLLDVHPVTNQEFLEFVKEDPRWRKSKVKKLFADETYLQTWRNDTRLGEDQRPNAPVTHVSWYAAKSYCKCQGKRLPTLDEWEYAARASESKPDAHEDKAYTQYILNWYETPDTYNNEVGSTFKNYWGVYDLHGLVWEWTLDFNSVMITGDSRGGESNTRLFCGAAALGANDLMNYAAFMRYAFRASLEGNYAIKNLGFRCARDLN